MNKSILAAALVSLNFVSSLALAGGGNGRDTAPVPGKTTVTESCPGHGTRPISLAVIMTNLYFGLGGRGIRGAEGNIDTNGGGIGRSQRWGGSNG